MSDEQRAEMLKQIKILLGIPDTDTSKDALLELLLDTTVDMVFNYCGITELPEGLERVVVRMTVDMYRIEGYGSNAGAGQQAQQVKRGDVSITYAQLGGNYNSMTGAGGADFIKNYRAQLNAFKKVVFS